MAAGRGPIPKDPRDLTSCPNVTEGEKTRSCPGRGLSHPETPATRSWALLSVTGSRSRPPPSVLKKAFKTHPDLEGFCFGK